MRIDIQARGFSLTESLEGHIRRRLAFALGNYDEHIHRVQVRLSDINGPRGGNDKQCHVHVVCAPLPDVVIEDVESDMYFAIDRAADRAGHTVKRRLSRMRDLRQATSVTG